MSAELFAVLFLNVFILAYGSNESPSIIIIGAGSAGIAAATKLWKNNFTNIRILEAENRIGGRIYSKKIGNAFVDLGGEWCHGEKDNIVYDMVKQYDLLRETDIDIRVYYSNGTLLDQEVSETMVEFSDSIHSSLNLTGTEGRCGDNFTSAGDCFDNIYNSTFIELYKNRSDLQTVTIDAKEWIQSYILSADSAFTLHDLALKSDFSICEGNQALNWYGRGYKTILELMLQQYPNPYQELPVLTKLDLNKEVIKVMLTDNDQIQVLTLDNTTYTADHVIFTPSLGVLKANHESLFKPALPEEKVRAIKNIGFGAIMKVIMIFPKTWWDTAHPFAFVFSAEDREKILTEFGRGPVKNGRSWLTSHMGFLTGEQNPKVIIGFFAGEIVPELEQESDEVVEAGCMYMFRKFLGGIYSNISDPERTIKTSWYNNPHFRGTYSYDSAKNIENGLRDKLAAPLIPKIGYPAVLFAGESTHHDHFSTVHGAIESGYREAGRLIDYYSKLKK